MKKILITGGAGFIGSNLVLAIKNDFEVFVLDNLDKQIHGENEDSYTYNLIKDKCVFLKGDVTNKADWEKALKNNIDIVIHLASQTGTGQSMYEATSYTDTNCIGTTILGDLLGKYSTVKKIILASSRSIYGEGKYFNKQGEIVYPQSRNASDLENAIFECLDPITKEPLIVQPTDEDSAISPISTYALTKYFQEKFLENICKTKQISFFGLRFQNVYGPGQSLKNPYTGIISIFSQRLKHGKDVFIFEDGKESRDFVYILDVVDAIVKSIKHDQYTSQLLNVGSGCLTNVLDIACILDKNINKNGNIIVNGQYRIGNIRHNFADISKIKRLLEFSPQIDIETGLKKFTEWLHTQEMETDLYESSLMELKVKGLLK